MKEINLIVVPAEDDLGVQQKFTQSLQKFKLTEQERTQIISEFNNTVMPAIKSAREVSKLGSGIDFHKRLSVGDCAVIVRFVSEEPSFLKKLVQRLIG